MRKHTVHIDNPALLNKLGQHCTTVMLIFVIVFMDSYSKCLSLYAQSLSLSVAFKVWFLFLVLVLVLVTQSLTCLCVLLTKCHTHIASAYYKQFERCVDWDLLASSSSLFLLNALYAIFAVVGPFVCLVFRLRCKSLYVLVGGRMPSRHLVSQILVHVTGATRPVAPSLSLSWLVNLSTLQVRPGRRRAVGLCTRLLAEILYRL